MNLVKWMFFYKIELLPSFCRQILLMCKDFNKYPFRISSLKFRMYHFQTQPYSYAIYSFKK